MSPHSTIQHTQPSIVGTEQPILTHLGIIMDGNRRWARSRGLSVSQGHAAGYEALKRITRAVFDRKIKMLTVYAFSTENWNRPLLEKQALFRLFETAVQEQLLECKKNHIQLRFIGDRRSFSDTLRSLMDDASDQTRECEDAILTIALNYGGRAEIVDALRRIIDQKIPASQLSEDHISQACYTKGLPDPELIIRTSGEQRLSGFLMWQSVYAELAFTRVYWPDFSECDIDCALADFKSRKRRYGC